MTAINGIVVSKIPNMCFFNKEKEIIKKYVK